MTVCSSSAHPIPCFLSHSSCKIKYFSRIDRLGCWIVGVSAEQYFGSFGWDRNPTSQLGAFSWSDGCVSTIWKRTIYSEQPFSEHVPDAGLSAFHVVLTVVTHLCAGDVDATIVMSILQKRELERRGNVFNCCTGTDGTHSGSPATGAVPTNHHPLLPWWAVIQWDVSCGNEGHTTGLDGQILNTLTKSVGFIGDGWTCSASLSLSLSLSHTHTHTHTHTSLS